MPPVLPSCTSLSAFRNSGRASAQSLYRKPFVPGICLRGSHGISSIHGNAKPRTLSVSSVPASNGSTPAAEGSAMSYKGNPDQDLGPKLRVLDWADSTCGMDKPFGSHTSFARTASGGGSSKANPPLISDSLEIPQGTKLDPRERLPPSPTETPPSSIGNSLKPPQCSFAISSVGPDGSKETGEFKMYGEPAFGDLVRMKWGQSKRE
jgi:hypothetical protein